MKVLHFSPHNEDCGIAKYTESYFSSMKKIGGVENTFFEFSPYQTRHMSSHEFSRVVSELRKELKKYDILHIQHEFGFFNGEQLAKLVQAARSLGKKSVVSYHTSPDLIIIPKKIGGIGPRSIVHFLKDKRHNNNLKKIHIMPLLQADKVLAHNEYTKGQLAKAGVPEDTISIIPHPTPSITKPAKSSFIADKLNKQPGDVIYGTVGYIHKFKGVDSAIKALKYLPGNYKLAILGGVKLDSNEQKLYDKLADLIISLGLKNRVYITGFIEDDNLLDSYIRECDLLAYPYRSEYYKGVGSGALNLGIANERPIVAYPVTTFKETNTHNQLVFTHSDSYYELARIIHNIDLKTQARLIHEYANVNSWDNLAVDLVDIYKSL